MRIKLLALILSVLWAVPCWAGGSSDFDSTDGIDLGSISAIDSATKLSCFTWVYFDSNSADMGVISNSEDVSFDGPLLYSDVAGSGNNSARVFVGDSTDSSSATVIGVANSAQSGSWRHIGYTLDTSSATGLRLYINGAEDANSPADATGLAGIDPGADTLLLGRTQGGAHLNGRMAYSACWAGKVLTLAEINEEMRHPGSIPGAEFFLPLWGNSDPAIDLSGNGNTGTITGVTEATDGPPVFLTGGPR